MDFSFHVTFAWFEGKYAEESGILAWAVLAVVNCGTILSLVSLAGLKVCMLFGDELKWMGVGDVRPVLGRWGVSSNGPVFWKYLASKTGSLKK